MILIQIQTSPLIQSGLIHLEGPASILILPPNCVASFFASKWEAQEVTHFRHDVIESFVLDLDCLPLSRPLPNSYFYNIFKAPFLLFQYFHQLNQLYNMQKLTRFIFGNWIFLFKFLLTWPVPRKPRTQEFSVHGKATGKGKRKE